MVQARLRSMIGSVWWDAKRRQAEKHIMTYVYILYIDIYIYIMYLFD